MKMIKGYLMEISQIIDNIFDTLGKVYKAQRIFINIDTEGLEKFYFYNFCEGLSNEIKDYEKKALLNIFNFPCFDSVKNDSHYISDVSNFIVSNNLQNSQVEKYLNKNDVESLILLPIVSENITYGLIIIIFDALNSITSEDLMLIEASSGQLSTVIEHIILYKKEREIVQRDILLKEIVNKIRSSIALPQIKHEFVNQVASLFGASMVFFGEYDQSSEAYFVSKDAEYRVSDDIKSTVGLDTKEIQGFSEYIKEVHLQGKDIIFEDVEKYLYENNLKGTGVEGFYKDHNIVSLVAINVYYRELFLGNIVITFNYKRHIKEEEINFVKNLAEQLGIAIYHAMLYAKERKASQREVVLRKISELISSSMDSGSIKRKLLSFICEYLEADRCFIVDFNQDINKFLPIRYEHLSSEREKSIIGVDINDAFPNFAEVDYLIKGNIIADIDTFEATSDFEPEKEKLKQYNVKSDYAFAMLYAGNVVGALVVHYTHKKYKLDEEQLSVLKHLATQTGIALYQTILYEKVLRSAQRESALRQIMLSSVTILNFEDVIKFIVTEAGKLFKADRCFFVEYDDTNETTFPIREYEQYRSSDEIRSHLEVPVNKESVEKFVSAIRQKQIVIANNIYDENLSKESFEMLIDGLSVKSYLIAPVYYRDYVYGSFVLHYVKEFKTFTNEDVDFAAAAANQAAVMLKQNELFEKEREAFEREKENKNLIEIMRSSMDKSVVKKLFVKNIGKFFNADRVFICEYSLKNKKLLPIDSDSEYLSTPNIKSFVGVDFADGNYVNFHQRLSEKGEVLIPSVKEFLNTDKVSDEEIKLLIAGQTKSSYSFPVVYEDKLIATFTIDFVQNEVNIKNDEIARIRKICAQLGIALDHAHLYQKAQECNFFEKSFRHEVAEKIKEPTNKILDNSTLLLQNEFERNVQIERLNSIIGSCNCLMELTKVK